MIGFAVGLVLGLVPVAVAELVMLNSLGMTQFDFLNPIGAPGVTVGAFVSLATTGLAAALAMRATRSVEID